MGLSRTVVIFFCVLATLASSMAENFHSEWSTKVNKSSSMKKVELGDAHVIKHGPSSDTAILQEKKDDCKSFEPSPPNASCNNKNNSANYSSDGENYFTSRKDDDGDEDNDEHKHKHKHHKHKHHKHHKGQKNPCPPGAPPIPAAPTIPAAPIIPDTPSTPTSDCSRRDMLGLTSILVAFICFL